MVKLMKGLMLTTYFLGQNDSVKNNLFKATKRFHFSGVAGGFGCHDVNAQIDAAFIKGAFGEYA